MFLAYQVVPKPRLKPRKILAFLDGFPQQPTKNVSLDDFEDNAGFWWFWGWCWILMILKMAFWNLCCFFQLSAASQMDFRDSNDTTVNSHGCRKKTRPNTGFCPRSCKVVTPYEKAGLAKNWWLNRATDVTFLLCHPWGTSFQTVFGGQSFHWFLVKSLRHF